MSFSIDANVLLYASDRSSAFHERALAFLEDCGTRNDLWCLTWPTIMSYLRIATHPAIFTTPLSSTEAAENISRLLALPHVRTFQEEDGFWETYLTVAAEFPMRGNAVPDAHIAALLRQHGVGAIYTNDADFKRFSFLTVRNPFAPTSAS